MGEFSGASAVPRTMSLYHASEAGIRGTEESLTRMFLSACE